MPTNEQPIESDRLREALMSVFMAGRKSLEREIETKGRGVPLPISSVTNPVLALIDSTCAERERRARINELNGIQLHYGHYGAQTYVTGEAMGILDRIAQLTINQSEQEKQ